MSKVSVIIPVYNTEKYLKQCLDSVINQTLSDLEIICINDGSTDNSLSILEEYAQKDSRIKILQKEHTNAGDTRNTGLKHATGEYIHFLDADDWVEPDAYSDLYQKAVETNSDVIKFRSWSYNSQTQKIQNTPFTDVSSVDQKLFNTCFSVSDECENVIKLPDSPWSGIYKKSFLSENNILFDSLICANDVGFFCRCIINAKKIYLSPKRFVFYRENQTNSLIAKRAENFACQIALYDIVGNEILKLEQAQQYIIKNHIIHSIFYWYNKCLNNYKINFKTRIKLKKQMALFLKKIKSEDLTPQNWQTYNDLSHPYLFELKSYLRRGKNFIKNKIIKKRAHE